MKEPEYEPDPQRVRNFLHVGEYVLHEGTNKVVNSITLVENSCLDGVDVPAVPWIAKGMFVVTLTSGKWAYGEQITQLPEEKDG